MMRMGSEEGGEGVVFSFLDRWWDEAGGGIESEVVETMEPRKTAGGGGDDGEQGDEPVEWYVQNSPNSSKMKQS